MDGWTVGRWDGVTLDGGTVGWRDSIVLSNEPWTSYRAKLSQLRCAMTDDWKFRCAMTDDWKFRCAVTDGWKCARK